MNKTQAEEWVKELTELLTDKNLIMVGVSTCGLNIRQNQKFDKSYYIEHSDGRCSVALSYSYGVMTGAEQWFVNPDERSVGCIIENKYDRTLHFYSQYSWAIADPDKDGKIWSYMNKMQERLWKVK